MRHRDARVVIGAPLAAALAVLLLVAAVLHPAARATAAEPDDEVRFVQLINELRVSQGLGPLTVDPVLQAESRVWAAQLRADGSLSHAPDLSVGITVEWAKLGENVGVGPAGQVQLLFDAFVASPGHYANLVDPAFTHIGVGVVYDPTGQMWTTHRFMALAGTPPQTTPPTTAAPTTSTPSTTTPPSTAAPVTAPTGSSPPSTTTPAPITSPPTDPSVDPTLSADRIETAPVDRDLVARVLTELARSGL